MTLQAVRMKRCWPTSKHSYDEAQHSSCPFCEGDRTKKMTTQTPTPRTDSNLATSTDLTWPYDFVFARFARKLERELIAAKKVEQLMTEAIESLNKVQAIDISALQHDISRHVQIAADLATRLEAAEQRTAETVRECANAVENIPLTALSQFAGNRWNAVALTKWIADKAIRAAFPDCFTGDNNGL